MAFVSFLFIFFLDAYFIFSKPNPMTQRLCRREWKQRSNSMPLLTKMLNWRRKKASQNDGAKTAAAGVSSVKSSKSKIDKPPKHKASKRVTGGKMRNKDEDSFKSNKKRKSSTHEIEFVVYFGFLFVNFVYLYLQFWWHNPRFLKINMKIWSEWTLNKWLKSTLILLNYLCTIVHCIFC